MKKAAVVLLLLAALGAGGVFFYRSQEKKVPRFKTARVEKGEITQSISATGNLNAVTTVQVGSQVSGTIRKIFVDFNSPVKKGQPIAQIDTRLFEASVAQARGAVGNALSSLEKAKAVTVNSQRILARNKELLPDGFVAQADVDNAQTDYDSAVAAEKGAQAQGDQARGALSVAETNLGYATIYSPVHGTVVSRNVDVGQTVAASFQTPTLFTIAQDLTKMQIDTNVDEADIGRAKVGQATNFTVDAYPEKTFSGRVTQVRNAPIITQNVVTYDVVIEVDNRDLFLKPGMTTNVSILTQTVKDVLKIPNAALRYRPSEMAKAEASEGRKEPKGARVYLVGKDGLPQAVPVKLGISDGAYTQIVEGTLKEGDLLITEEQRNGKSGRPAGALPGGGGFR
ncbi:MAG: efflux RND transporter periplasmic adaptor subunit [Candidatus Deferrimicrobiaceae bacterium]